MTSTDRGLTESSVIVHLHQDSTWNINVYEEDKSLCLFHAVFFRDRHVGKELNRAPKILLSSKHFTGYKVLSDTWVPLPHWSVEVRAICLFVLAGRQLADSVAGVQVYGSIKASWLGSISWP